MGCSLALVLWGAMGDARAQDKPARARQIDLQETDSMEVLSNMNLLNARPESLKRFEEELSRPLSTFKPDLERPLAPYRPVTIVVPNRRGQDNWMSPKDLMPKTAQEDWLDGISVGKKGQPKTSQEQFLEMLNRQDPGRGSANASGSVSSRRPGLSGDLADDPSLPSAVREKAQALKDLISHDGSGNLFAPSSRSPLSDFLGSRETGLSRDDLQAHKAYMDAYRREVLGSVPPPAATPFNPLGLPAAVPTPGYVGGLDTLASPSRRGMDSSPGTYTPATPGSLRDLNAALLNQWNPMYTPPKPETPKASPPAPMTAEVPRRKF
jgi:hypothetical protein